jgi:hypothetical protein
MHGRREARVLRCTINFKFIYKLLKQTGETSILIDNVIKFTGTSKNYVRNSQGSETTSDHHAHDRLGLTHATMTNTIRSDGVIRSKSVKIGLIVVFIL